MSETDGAFPKGARLLCSADFQRVFDGANKSVDRYFVIFARVNGFDLDRLGLAISKKCARRAVDRNRVKRLVREVFRTSEQHLPGIDVVVICRPGTAGISNLLLTNSLSRHFRKVRFQLCGSS